MILLLHDLMMRLLIKELHRSRKPAEPSESSEQDQVLEKLLSSRLLMIVLSVFRLETVLLQASSLQMVAMKRLDSLALALALDCNRGLLALW